MAKTQELGRAAMAKNRNCAASGTVNEDIPLSQKEADS